MVSAECLGLALDVAMKLCLLNYSGVLVQKNTYEISNQGDFHRFRIAGGSCLYFDGHFGDGSDNNRSRRSIYVHRANYLYQRCGDGVSLPGANLRWHQRRACDARDHPGSHRNPRKFHLSVGSGSECPGGGSRRDRS
jgi:hypothetical protein